MFNNLKAEMARESVTNEMIANKISIHIASVSSKLNGKTEWTRREMFEIKNHFFPELSVDYLFQRSDK